MGPAGSLYIHVPYCVRKCPYCDFYKVARPDADRSPNVTSGFAFLRALRVEAEARQHVCPRPQTVFIGGGTPSALTAAEWDELLAILHGTFDLADVIEWTVECNPNSLTAEKAAKLAGAGVNRLSIGVQSLDAAALAFLGRAHTAEDVPAAFAAATAAGITDLNLDLIASLGPAAKVTEPERTLADIAQIFDHPQIGPNLSHISVYSLIVEEGTPFFARATAGEFMAAEEEIEAICYEAVTAALREHGFEHYEISNFARDGRRCRHNLAYWRCEPYLGLGPSAHSFDGHRRWGNVRDLAAYARALDPQSASNSMMPTAEKLAAVTAIDETLTAEQKWNERLLMGMRLADGIDLAEAMAIALGDTNGAESRQRIGELGRARTTDLINFGYLRWAGSQVALTPAGFLMADRIILELASRLELGNFRHLRAPSIKMG